MIPVLIAAALALPLNPAVTQQTIRHTICVPGWTTTVRPPVSYTDRIKRQEMQAAGIPWSHASEIELDHIISLTIGGDPRARENLRLQTWAPTAPRSWQGKVDVAAKVKDKLEVRLNHLVCSGQMTLLDAQKCIWTDWRACAQHHPMAVQSRSRRK